MAKKKFSKRHCDLRHFVSLVVPRKQILVLHQVTVVEEGELEHYLYLEFRGLKRYFLGSPNTVHTNSQIRKFAGVKKTKTKMVKFLTKFLSHEEKFNCIGR